MFKDFFKYYKRKKPPPDFDDVIDVEKAGESRVIRVLNRNEILGEINDLGLRVISSWRIFEFSDIPGLILIENPFTTAGQRYWMIKCLKDFSKKPNKLNIDVHGILKPEENWWDVCVSDRERAKNLIPKLRWATLGYHHNWDTKHYSENFRTEIPKDLARLTKILAQSVGFSDFVAEAAIINYYRMDSTLAGHVDHSEVNIEAPLISVSFGQTAIFLIGGPTPEDTPNAIFLRSGDVVIMSGQSRKNYHGIPRILATKNVAWDSIDELKTSISINDDDWIGTKAFIAEARINMNVRQVLKTGQLSLSQDI